MNPRRLPIALVPVLVLVLALTLLDAPASFADDAAPSPEPPCGGSVPVGANVAADRPMSPGDYFSYPNRSRAEKRAIRKRVLDTIKSTNGEYCADTGRTDLQGNPVYEVRHGVIKVATWSFNDWDITDARFLELEQQHPRQRRADAGARRSRGLPGRLQQDLAPEELGHTPVVPDPPGRSPDRQHAQRAEVGPGRAEVPLPRRLTGPVRFAERSSPPAC